MYAGTGNSCNSVTMVISFWFFFFAHGRYILGGRSYDLKENVNEQMSAGGILISLFTDTMNGKE